MSLRVNQPQSNKYLFSCLHFDTRSNRLLSSLSFSLKLHITSFSKWQRLHDYDTILYPEDFLKMDHLISKSLFSFLSSKYISKVQYDFRVSGF